MQAVRIVLAVLGGLFAVTILLSVGRTLIVPRGLSGGMGRWAARSVSRVVGLISRRVPDYVRRDRVLATEGPLILVGLLMSWMLGLLVAYALLLWPFVGNAPGAFRESGSSLLTLGFDSQDAGGPTVLDLIAAASGLSVFGLLIGYLPTIYSSFNRRETEVTLLAARAGSPPWGPELLARTHIGFQDRDLTPLYAGWERWAADVAESHANYPVLVRFRSPSPWTNWVVALLAVMDSAALYHAVAPSEAPASGRLALRMGFTCLRSIATSLKIPFDPDPRPDAELVLTKDEFLVALERLADVGFPMERSADDAWMHFRGWRVNYEALAYRIAYDIDAVASFWTGPRRDGGPDVAPVRPQVRTPDEPDGIPIQKASGRTADVHRRAAGNEAARAADIGVPD